MFLWLSCMVDYRECVGCDREREEEAAGSCSLRCSQEYYSFFFIERECIEIIYCQYYPAIWGVISNTLPLWKTNRMASSRNELENTPLGNLHPWALKIATGRVFSNTFLLSAVYYYDASLQPGQYWSILWLLMRNDQECMQWCSSDEKEE